MKKTDIFLVLCPLFPTALPPLGIAYVAEYLTAHGHSIVCHDLNIALYHQASEQEKQEWHIQNNPVFAGQMIQQYFIGQHAVVKRFLCEIEKRQPSIVALSIFKSNMQCSMVFASMIKERFPDITIVAGGPQVTAMIRAHGAGIMHDFPVDHWVCGEGERALQALVEKCETSYCIDLPDEQDIHHIPYPRFQGFPLNAYNYGTKMPLLMSRGCIRQCTFCSERLLSHRFRVRHPEHVMDEINFHMRTRNIRQFVFYDSLVNGNLDALKELCDRIIAERRHIQWEAQCCIRQDMTEALFAKMKRAGCFNMFIGLESGSDTILKRMNKGFTTDEAHDFFTRAHHAGCHFEISLITDFPGETEEQFQETISFIENNHAYIPKIAQLNPYVPYEGTAAWAEANKPSGAFSDHTSIVSEKAHTKMHRMLACFKEMNIPFTKSYIGNLLPKTQGIADVI